MKGEGCGVQIVSKIYLIWRQGFEILKVLLVRIASNLTFLLYLADWIISKNIKP